MKHFSFTFLLASLFLAAAVAEAKPARHPTYEPDGPAPAVLSEGAPRLIPVSARERFQRDVLTNLPQTEVAPAVTLRGWRGEKVLAQVLVESPAGFGELTIEPLILHGKDHSALPARVDIVRYTLANGKLVADILDGTAQTRFAGVVRPLLISVEVPRVGPPSVEGTLAVRVNGTRLTAKVRVEAERWELPPPSDWKCHVDLWQHPEAVARWHDVEPWSEEHFELMLPEMRRLAAMGQKTITATLIDEAWGGQTYDRFGSMVLVTRRADGSWAYDYSRFDRWVLFMKEIVGLENANVSCYTMVPWSLTFPYYDEAQGRTVAPKLVPGTPEYAAFWEPFLTAFVEHLREMEWEDCTRLAMDERPDALFKPALELARRVAPTLRIVAACDRPSAINGDFDDVSYSYEICEQLVPVAAERRAQGKQTTFYVCLHPARPNTFMASDLAEAEWLLPMAAHYRLDGMLRWAYQSWVENPLRCQDFVTWPSGDTSLVYPGGRSSLRLEALRNGIETFEKIRLLRARAAKRDQMGVLAPVEEALASFTVARGHEPGHHAADLAALDVALEKATAELEPPRLSEPAE